MGFGHSSFSFSYTSGKYIEVIGHYQVEVEKEGEDIKRKRLTERKKDSRIQTALDEYYDAAKDLYHSQAVYMTKVEKLQKVIDNPDIFLSIINHVLLLSVQVMVTTKEQDKQTTGMSDEEIVVAPHLPVAEEWKVGRSHGVKMLAGMIYFILYKQVTGSTAGQNKCAVKFGCGTTPFKHIITGKWQEGSKRKGKAKSTRSSRRLAEVAKQEQSGEKGSPAKKQGASVEY